MPFGPTVLMGCLPVWIEVAVGKDADTPNGAGEYWEEVEAIYWLKRDGSKGSPISQRLWAKAEKADPYFCGMLEGFWDDLRFARREAERAASGCVCDDSQSRACVRDCAFRPFHLTEAADLHDPSDGPVESQDGQLRDDPKSAPTSPLKRQVEAA